MKKKDIIALLNEVDDEQDIPVKLALDVDDDSFDISCNIASQGAEEEREILIVPDVYRNKFDKEEKIHDYLLDKENGDVITIVLDTNEGIYVEDGNDNLLREMEFKEGFDSVTDRKTRVQLIMRRLIGIL